MQLPILIEPVDGGRFRACAGSPFDVVAEGATAAEATARLSALIEERLGRGARLATIPFPKCASGALQSPLQVEPLPEDDWFFRTLNEAIAENRRLEDEADRKACSS